MQRLNREKISKAFVFRRNSLLKFYLWNFFLKVKNIIETVLYILCYFWANYIDFETFSNIYLKKNWNILKSRKIEDKTMILYFFQIFKMKIKKTYHWMISLKMMYRSCLVERTDDVIVVRYSAWIFLHSVFQKHL